jgi:hypothetical protein
MDSHGSGYPQVNARRRVRSSPKGSAFPPLKGHLWKTTPDRTARGCIGCSRAWPTCKALPSATGRNAVNQVVVTKKRETAPSPNMDSERIPPLLDRSCMDCGIDTRATGEYYSLKDSLWRRINPLVLGMLCLGCAEDRMGRVLCKRDFSSAPINAESAERCPGLARRLNRRTTAKSRVLRPRMRKILGKRPTQSRLGLMSSRLMAHVGRNGRVKPTDIMQVARSLPALPAPAPLPLPRWVLERSQGSAHVEKPKKR